MSNIDSIIQPGRGEMRPAPEPTFGTGFIKFRDWLNGVHLPRDPINLPWEPHFPLDLGPLAGLGLGDVTFAEFPEFIRDYQQGFEVMPTLTKPADNRIIDGMFAPGVGASGSLMMRGYLNAAKVPAKSLMNATPDVVNASRREFLKNAGKTAVGAAAVTGAGKGALDIAESLTSKLAKEAAPQAVKAALRTAPISFGNSIMLNELVSNLLRDKAFLKAFKQHGMEGFRDDFGRWQIHPELQDMSTNDVLDLVKQAEGKVIAPFKMNSSADDISHGVKKLRDQLNHMSGNIEEMRSNRFFIQEDGAVNPAYMYEDMFDVGTLLDVDPRIVAGEILDDTKYINTLPDELVKGLRKLKDMDIEDLANEAYGAYPFEPSEAYRLKTIHSSDRKVKATGNVWDEADKIELEKRLRDLMNSGN